MKRFIGKTVPALVVIGLLAACSSSSKGTSSSGGATGSVGSASGGKNTASAPGVTATSVKVGLITEETGPAASQAMPGIPAGFKARIDMQNDNGGVYGRKITFIVEDDATSPAGNATAAGVELARGVFAVDDNSALAFGAAKTLQSKGVPVVGGGYDGPEWTQDPNMFSTSYSQFAKEPRYAVDPTLLKKAGANRFAVIGYAISPSSSLAAKYESLSLQQAGFSVPYLNTSLPFGTVNTTAIALQMKQENVDSISAPIDANTELALVNSGIQAGIKWRYVSLATGYGQEWLDNPQAVASTQGAYFGALQVPVELHTPATIAEQAAFKKYANFSGVPSFDWSEGWTSADLLIKGLEAAGQNPTRASFIANLRQVTSYDAGGLLSTPVNFAAYQTPPPRQCGYAVQLVGHNFVPTSSTPTCTDLVPGT
jgi:branched-chain amino acid transport system substrate-binding protein